jgi:hypothetical protein
MARPKAQFTGGQTTLPVNFTDKNLQKDLVVLYLEEKSRPDYIGEFYPGNETLADHFAVAVIEAATFLLYFKQVNELLVPKQDLIAEINTLLKIAENAESLRNISPGISCYLGRCYRQTEEAAGNLDELYEKFLVIKKHLECSDSNKFGKTGIKEKQIYAFFDNIAPLFQYHGFNFGPGNPEGDGYNFSENVVDYIFSSIAGDEFDYALSTIRKFINQYKINLKDNIRSFYQEHQGLFAE